MGRAKMSGLGISIHSARVGGDLMLFKSFLYFIISIHSARVGGDIARVEAIPGGRLISIHSARVGGDAVSSLTRV